MTIKDFIQNINGMRTSFYQMTIIDAGRNVLYNGGLSEIPDDLKRMDILQGTFIPGSYAEFFVPQIIREVRDIDIF